MTHFEKFDAKSVFLDSISEPVYLVVGKHLITVLERVNYLLALWDLFAHGIPDPR